MAKNGRFRKNYPGITPKRHEITPKQHIIIAPKPLEERALRHVESSQTRASACCGARCVSVYAGAAWSRECVLLGGGDPERDISEFNFFGGGREKKRSWVQVQFVRIRRVFRDRMVVQKV